MIRILTDDDREKAVRRLRFCYLCGEPLGPKRGSGWNRDHTPPTSYVTGRGAALPMRTHPECNAAWSLRDERGGQLMSTMIGRYPSRTQTRIDVTNFIDAETGTSFFGVREFGIETDVRRIVRAFHAALYDEFLAEDGILISLPFASGHAPSGVPVPDPIPDWHRAAVIDLRRSQGFDRLDHLACGGGECDYICTWTRASNRWRCVFGLRLHEWGNLGDPAFQQRGCVGLYHRNQLPSNASTAPSIAVPVRLPNPLDPFAE